ncbi:MAG: ABC-three component system protein [Gemmataceae bacterium]
MDGKSTAKGSSKKATAQGAAPPFTPTFPTAPAQPCTPQQILYGPPVDPRDRITLYSEAEFENFVREWAFYYKQLMERRYVQVSKFAGAGDKGRDVVGHIEPMSTSGKLDIYQCKHYRRPLQPSDVWIELGKLCYFTFKGQFAVPEHYRFVCPHDMGPDLWQLLQNPDELRTRLIAEWAKHVEKVIIKNQTIKLKDQLLDWVMNFDFKRVGYKGIDEIIEEHRKTTRYAPRFGGGLQIPRSQDMVPPATIDKHEQRYVKQLIEAYADHRGSPVSLETLASLPEFNNHFNRSRERYFCAETLRNDVRDNLPHGVTFEQVQDQIHETVIDIAEDSSHKSGFVRVKAVTNKASTCHLQDHPLKTYMNPKILMGICHQLANVDRLKWVQE